MKTLHKIKFFTLAMLLINTIAILAVEVMQASNFTQTIVYSVEIGLMVLLFILFVIYVAKNNDKI